MILTVTMNPSIDTAYRMDKLKIDDVNRAVPRKTAGGKGLNVARVLTQLGADVLATGLAGGHLGAYLCELAAADGIPCDFAPVAGETRVCLNILHEGNQTEILEAGPEVAPEELAAFCAAFARLVDRADVVTISGSLPRGVDAGTYAELVAVCAAAGKPVLLDTSGVALDAALAAPVKPTLIKPNLSEMNALLGTAYAPADLPQLQAALKRDPRFAGLEWVVVTMGGAGAVAFHGAQGYRVEMPAIELINATGSGDATIAGFAFALAAGADDETLLRTGNTCGTLNAMDPVTGHLSMEAWECVYEGCRVTML